MYFLSGNGERSFEQMWYIATPRGEHGGVARLSPTSFATAGSIP